MRFKELAVIALIAFIGMCGIISVDRECAAATGEGGKAGLTLQRTEEGNVRMCLFGLEAEFDW